MSAITSQKINAALWQLVEEADTDGKYDGLAGTTLVERITKIVQRELPADLK